METICYKYKFVNEKYFYVLFEKGGENKYTIPVYKEFENNKCNKKVKLEIDNNFLRIIDKMFEVEIDDFLNFHYNEFTGDKNLFLTHTEQLLINDTWIIRSEISKDYLKQWIEKKKNDIIRMKTIYFQYKETETDDCFIFFNNGGEDKYLIPVWNSPENNGILKYQQKKHDTYFLKYLVSVFIKLLEYMPDTEIDNFLDFHYKEFTGAKHLFLNYVDVQTKRIIVIKRNILLHWVEEKKQQLKESVLNIIPQDKIKWNGKPSHLAYILKTLTINNIELPPEVLNNKSKTAKYFLNFFKVDNPDSFIRIYQNDNLPTYATKQDLNKLIVDPSSKDN